MAQGESILLKLPRGKTFLIDLGSSTYPWRAGEEIYRELGRRGILKLDGFILTHPDKDHTSGVSSLYRHISIERFFYSQSLEKNLSAPSTILEEMKAEALSRNTILQPVFPSLELRGLGYKLTSFSLVPSQKITENNLSLVSLLEIHGCRFLFTGDIEKEAEHELLKKKMGSIHVLKVPHHGSITSSHWEFLKMLKPQHAVISVGSKNRYGHPRPEVLKRLLFFKTKILRTDFHGFISYKINSLGEVSCETALGSCGQFQCQI